MLKNISNLGKALNKKEQQSVNGGTGNAGSRCSSIFISSDENNSDGSTCLLLSPAGNIVEGCIINGQCCAVMSCGA